MRGAGTRLFLQILRSCLKFSFSYTTVTGQFVEHYRQERVR